MSVLHDRIARQGAVAEGHPVGTGATPMVMPMTEHAYDPATETLLYGSIHPLVTADGATIPARPDAHGHGGPGLTVPPAGRP
jgi:hypothetical protein